jgi:hypothetical protein
MPLIRRNHQIKTKLLVRHCPKTQSPSFGMGETRGFRWRGGYWASFIGFPSGTIAPGAYASPYSRPFVACPP